VDSVFLSFSFRETTRPFLADLQSLLEDQEIRPTLGKNLEGRPLSSEIERLIEGADAFISILTPEAILPDGTGQPTLWVYRELEYARRLGKPNIAIKHHQVTATPGEYEYIDWDPQSSCPTLLRLNSTLAAWKRSVGRRAKVRIFPAEIESLIGSSNAQTRYRLRRAERGEVGNWMTAILQSEPGGTFAYLTGVWTDALIEIMIEADGRRWTSKATPQALHVVLIEGGRP
jgi:hypothetical protein